MAIICGKGLPPRAALLLSLDFLCLVIVAPLLFLGPELATTPTRSFAAILWTLMRLMAVGISCQVLFYYNDLYNLRLVRQPRQMMARVCRAFAWMFLASAAAGVLLVSYSFPLSKVLAFSGILLFIAMIVRVTALPTRRERLLILGSGDETADLHEAVEEHPEWNLAVYEIRNPSLMDISAPKDFDPREDFDRVIVCNGRARSERLLKRLLSWKMNGLHVEDADRFYERSTGRVLTEGLTVEDCLFSSDVDTGVYLSRWKQYFDKLAATALLILCLPVIALVALAVWARRDGPVFFVQQRTGIHGEPFSIIKFRTMSKGKAGSGSKWATEEEHRITTLGRLLRKYRLDELPQLINVARGEMSLVGPRPEQPEFCRLLAEHIPFYDLRHSVLPGLTGWAQVRYHYGSGIEESRRKLEYDLFYVKHASLWLDCAIAIETVKVVLVGRGAK